MPTWVLGHIAGERLHLLYQVVHPSSRLILLSRINGDAPRAANISAGRFR